MGRVSKARLQNLAELLTDWSLRLERTVANPATELTSSEHAEWATWVSGDVKWAFDDLHAAVPTDEGLATLGVVAMWGMAGMLHEALTIMSGTPHLAEEFTRRLEEGGYVPFVIPKDQNEPEEPAPPRE